MGFIYQNSVPGAKRIKLSSSCSDHGRRGVIGFFTTAAKARELTKPCVDSQHYLGIRDSLVSGEGQSFARRGREIWWFYGTITLM